MADDYSTFSQQVVNIAVTQIESVVYPDGIPDDIRWKSMAFISFLGYSHPAIVAQWPLSCQYRVKYTINNKWLESLT